ncbi:hypothetical protein H0H93_008136 [Arthromyces matolae]|nr:hypothetical protein H0H93_008136 [Arthromyces matolae]
MVGRSAKLGKQSPPHILAETTTTRTERTPVVDNSPRHDTFKPSAVDEHGLVLDSTRSSFYIVDKDLPSIPADEPVDSATNSQRGGSIMPEDHGISPAFVNDTIASIPSKQSASALAEATIGVLLPVATSSSSKLNEVNTVLFAPAPSPSSLSSARPQLRKSRSAQKLRIQFVPEEDELKRSRGISFNSPARVAGSKNAATVKNKAHEDQSSPSTTSSHFIPKGLTRRASFWLPRKSQPQDSQLPLSSLNRPSTAQPQHSSHSTPAHNFGDTSTKPFNLGAHTRQLSRSHSAHSLSQHVTSEKKGVPSAVKGDVLPDNFSPSHPVSASSIPRYPESAPKSTVGVETLRQGRQRAQTNPPILNRLSLGWLPTSIPSPSPSRVLNHSPLVSRPHTSSSTLDSFKGRQNTFPFSVESPTASQPSGLPYERRTSVAVPIPLGHEEPPDYLRRLRTAVSKAEIAAYIYILSPNLFYGEALRAYIGEFDFMDDPLDIALRKLLMDVGLPRETQQIDRVIEAFANRYLQCNPELFSSEDHPYILAFSLIMLHTDVFNKSNKRKMSKADYIKNTRLPGLSTEVLECFYDNIVFAPFIFVEDPLDFNGQRGISQDASSQSLATSPSSLISPVTPIMRGNKIDPYYLIANAQFAANVYPLLYQNRLASLRVDAESFVPRENPFSYEGTAGPWDETQLQQMFANASQLQLHLNADSGHVPPSFTKGAIGGLASPPGYHGIVTSSPAPTTDTWTLKLTKVGLLTRKDDVVEGGKKAANRKWKPWSVILTGSQLLFFRNLLWATALPSLFSGERTVSSQSSSLLRPDELLSVRGALAHEHTFRLLLSDGRHLLLQTPNDKELNDWIAAINYASAFKTAGVRIRPLEMSKEDVELTGIAAATSHLHDLKTQSDKLHAHNTVPDRTSGRSSTDTIPVSSTESHTGRVGKLTIVTSSREVDFEAPTAPEVDGAEQFKATFDQVKADLAAGLLSSSDQPLPPSHAPVGNEIDAHLPSRMAIIQTKVNELDLRISAAQSQLDAKLRFIRNISTLTPFQKSTRERLSDAVQRAAQRVKQARLELLRLVCHRDILAKDVASEERSWSMAKTIALRAATETIQQNYNGIPRMTLSKPATKSVDIPQAVDDSSSWPLFDSSPSRRSESSLCESFYSAMDFGPDWLSSEDLSSSIFGSNQFFDSPTLSATSSLHSHVTDDRKVDGERCVDSPWASSSPVQEPLSNPSGNPKDEAEEWNKTRCAQRVSLVRLPSDMYLKPLLRSTTMRFSSISQVVFDPSYTSDNNVFESMEDILDLKSLSKDVACDIGNQTPTFTSLTPALLSEDKDTTMHGSNFATQSRPFVGDPLNYTSPYQPTCPPYLDVTLSPFKLQQVTPFIDVSHTDPCLSFSSSNPRTAPPPLPQSLRNNQQRHKSVDLTSSAMQVSLRRLRRSPSLWTVTDGEIPSNDARERHIPHLRAESPLSTEEKLVLLRRARKIMQVFGTEVSIKLVQGDQSLHCRSTSIRRNSLSTILSADASPSIASRCRSNSDSSASAPPLEEQRGSSTSLDRVTPLPESAACTEGLDVPTSFSARRRRAAKLAHFFGVNYQDISQSIAQQTIPRTPVQRSVILNRTSHAPVLEVDVKVASGRRFWRLSDGKMKSAEVADVIGKLRGLKAGA